MKITVDEVVYNVVKEKEINRNCRGCFLKSIGYVNCLEITRIDCLVEKVIFLKVPDSLKNCVNCGNSVFDFDNYYCKQDKACINYDKWEAKE